MDAIKIVKHLIFSKPLFICSFDFEQPALELFIKNNYEYVNYCIPVEFTVFQNANCIHRKTTSCCQVALVLLFWAQKRKLDAKYSTKVSEMKSLTCGLLPAIPDLK